MPHLENWAIAGGFVSVYRAPDRVTRRLVGVVTGHERLDDGREVTTSELQSIDYEARTARTKNSDYTLGEPDPAWLEWCDENNIDCADVRRAS